MGAHENAPGAPCSRGACGFQRTATVLLKRVEQNTDYLQTMITPAPFGRPRARRWTSVPCRPALHLACPSAPARVLHQRRRHLKLRHLLAIAPPHCVRFACCVCVCAGRARGTPPWFARCAQAPAAHGGRGALNPTAQTPAAASAASCPLTARTAAHAVFSPGGAAAARKHHLRSMGSSSAVERARQAGRKW